MIILIAKRDVYDYTRKGVSFSTATPYIVKEVKEGMCKVTDNLGINHYIAPWGIFQQENFKMFEVGKSDNSEINFCALC